MCRSALRPVARRADSWSGVLVAAKAGRSTVAVMECTGSAADVAEQLNRLGQTHQAITDVTLCENGCFNLEGWIIEPGATTQQDTDHRKWFPIGFSNTYSAEELLASFPDARDGCPGVELER